uniref:F-box domain-containing protein n=1 Tax=Ditylenchus dipsaci TaxID=166011 RepID=A0A915DN45_9BILA
MPELVCSPALHTLLPELKSNLSSIFGNVECEMEPCPDFQKGPYNLCVSSLGQLIYIVPNSISSVEACRQIVGGNLSLPRKTFIYTTTNIPPAATATNGSVEVDKPKKKKIIKRLVVRNGSPSVKEAPAAEVKIQENATAPFLDTSTVNQQVTGTPETPAATFTAVNGVKQVQKKPVDNNNGSRKENSPVGDIHENGINIPNGFSKKTEINGVNGIRPTAVNSENKILQRVNSEPNKKNGGKVGKMAAMFDGRSQSQENSVESVTTTVFPASVASNTTEKRTSDECSDKSSGVSSISDSHSDTLNSAEQEFHETKPPGSVQSLKTNSEDMVSDEDNLSYSSALNSSSFHLNGNSLAIEIAANGWKRPPHYHLKGPLNRRSLNLTPPTCSTPARLLNGHNNHLSGRVLSPISSASSMPEPEEEDETLYQVLQDDCSQRPSVDRDDSEMLDLSFRDDYSYCSNTTEMFDRTFMRRKESLNNNSNHITSSSKVPPEVVVNGQKCGSRSFELQRQVSPLKERQMVRGMSMEMPVIVLQHVLNSMSFDELSELRRVHPHWDELCGQMLNSGYYQLIHMADRLLTDCQRRMHREKHLVNCGQIMTKIQVHVLNPVDVLRAAMDEGVLCFPYGRLLDKAFDLLGRVERVIQGVDDSDTILNWERLAELSRRHKFTIASSWSPKLRRGWLNFLVEASVNKLEKVAEKAKDDVRFEIEQLKSANQQLKKDNRELKQTCLKLDNRIEVLERKFKTMARLLQ